MEYIYTPETSGNDRQNRSLWGILSLVPGGVILLAACYGFGYTGEPIWLALMTVGMLLLRLKT